MSTHIDLAPAKSTPKIYSTPFTVTDMQRADYAGGLPMFTPNAGDVVAFVWITETATWDVAATVDFSDVNGTVAGTQDTNESPVGVLEVAEGTELRLFGDGNSTATTGAAVMHMLVFPVSAA